jgi:hypothetical protein
VGGTIDSEGGDQSGLFWTPKNLDRATAVLNFLTDFADWLVDRYQAVALNPWRTASPSEQIAYWRRFDKRRPQLLLMHTQGVERATANAGQMRAVRVAIGYGICSKRDSQLRPIAPRPTCMNG